MWRPIGTHSRNTSMARFRGRQRLCRRDASSNRRTLKDWFFRPGVEALEARRLLSGLGAAPALVADYAGGPMTFEANQGQTDAQVQFLSRGTGYALFLTPTEAVLSLQQPASAPGAGGPGAVNPAASPGTVLSMQLVGGNTAPRVVGLDELAGKSNYLRGNDPAQWRVDVPNYARVEYQDVYPGVNLIYHGSEQQLEYDFVVAPGADPNAIKLSFQGAGGMDLDAQGNLVLHTAGGDVVEHAPVLSQEVDGVSQAVSGSYVLQDDGQVGFTVGAYDATLPLVIDPVLAYSTYLGGSDHSDPFGTQSGNAVAVDGKGNAYITGWTLDSDFPIKDPFQDRFNGFASTDAFVVKLDPAGQPVYSTYLGGNPDESGFSQRPIFYEPDGSPGPTANEGFQTVDNEGTGIAVDASGSVYLTGTTYTDAHFFGGTAVGFFPIVGGFQATPGGYDDTFVAKLDATGRNLVYSSYLGGPHDDEGTGIAVDAQGNAYMVGTLIDSAEPAAVDAFAPIPDPVTDPTGFVVKVNADGSKGYQMTLGSSGSDTYARGIAVDAAGDAYVTGTTADSFADKVPNFAATQQPVPESFGGLDAYVARLDPDGTLLSTVRLGGTNEDVANAVALDGQGNVYITGSTNSINFPTTPGAFQAAKPPSVNPPISYPNAFVAKLSADLSELAYSTYLGGGTVSPDWGSPYPDVQLPPVGDVGRAIAVDPAGNAYVGGETTSFDFPTASAVQPGYGGGISDAFVTELDPAGSALVYSTYLGGGAAITARFANQGGTSDGLAAADAVHGIAVDAAGNAYVVGETTSTDFPVTDNAFQKSFPIDTLHPYDLNINASGEHSAVFVARIGPPLNVIAKPVQAYLGEAFRGEVASFTTPYLDAAPGDFTVAVDWGDGTKDVSTDIRADASPGGPGAPFHVFGNHTYTKLGAYPVVVTVTDTKHSVTIGGVQQNVSATTAYDVSRAAGYQGETTIAIDPSNPKRLFAASNDGAGATAAFTPPHTTGGLFAAYSTDGGVTWLPSGLKSNLILASDGPNDPQAALADPVAAFDQFGNLFLAYVGSDKQSIGVVWSSDGGKTFDKDHSAVLRRPPGANAAAPADDDDPEHVNLDKPVIATGPGDAPGTGSVWVTFLDVDNKAYVAAGARVTALGVVGDFTQTDISGGRVGNFGGVAVGPGGQVVAAWQNLARTGPASGNPAANFPVGAILVNADPDGVAAAGHFQDQPSLTGLAPNIIGAKFRIPPQQARGIAIDIQLAYDRSPGPHHGRLYLVYTDVASRERPNDTDIYEVYSDNNGASWSPSVLVNDDKTLNVSGGTGSQFFPALAVDQKTGDVAVSWYDTRFDSAGVRTDFMAAVSGDGGQTFSANVRVSSGESDAQSPAPNPPGLNRYGQGNQYGDYTGLAFANGFLYPDWADNSAELAGNPDRPNFDVAAARVAVAHVTAAPPVVVGVPQSLTEGGSVSGTVATFTDSDKSLGPNNFTATVDWGDGARSAADSIQANGAGGFDVRASHPYARAGAYVLGITVHDVPHNLDATTVGNASQRFGSQAEGTIAIDPTNPKRLFIASNAISSRIALFAGYSTDGGGTWNNRIMADGRDGLPIALSDPNAAFDRFGNLYLTYITTGSESVVVVMSTDGGRTFKVLDSFAGPGDTDQPKLETGPGDSPDTASVWVTLEASNPRRILVEGARVTGSGVNVSFGTPIVVPGAADGLLSDVAIGPMGQVLVSWEDTSTTDPRLKGKVLVNVNPDGLKNPAHFAPRATVAADPHFFGTLKPVGPQNVRGVDANPRLAWDASGGPHNGRVYLSYMGTPQDGSSITNIYLMWSDDNGASWSTPTQVNDDPGTNSRFFPSLAVDPSTGDVGVSWYDARNDPNNTKTLFFAAVSSDGGQTFSRNVPLSVGSSDATDPGLDQFGARFQYGDYTGLAFSGGVLYPVWADNSTELGRNPNPPNFDLAVARTPTAHVADAPLTAQNVDLSATEGVAFTNVVATFTDADPGGKASYYTATVDWGDGVKSGATAIQANDAGGFDVLATHTYREEGTRQVGVTINDRATSTFVSKTIVVADAPLTDNARAITPGEGVEFHGAVATFTDADAFGAAGDYTAAIDWGDGARSDADSIVANGSGGFDVLGTHTYTQRGPYAMTVTIKDAASPLVVLATVKAKDPPPVALPPLPPFSLFQGVPSGTVTLANFTVPGAVETGDGEYTATIDWGDNGPIDTVTPSVSGDTITVAGGHTYTRATRVFPSLARGRETSLRRTKRASASLSPLARSLPERAGPPGKTTAAVRAAPRGSAPPRAGILLAARGPAHGARDPDSPPLRTGGALPGLEDRAAPARAPGGVLGGHRGLVGGRESQRRGPAPAAAGARLSRRLRCRAAARRPAAGQLWAAGAARRGDEPASGRPALGAAIVLRVHQEAGGPGGRGAGAPGPPPGGGRDRGRGVGFGRGVRGDGPPEVLGDVAGVAGQGRPVPERRDPVLRSRHKPGRCGGGRGFDGAVEQRPGRRPRESAEANQAARLRPRRVPTASGESSKRLMTGREAAYSGEAGSRHQLCGTTTS
jgi:hypothetical protein